MNDSSRKELVDQESGKTRGILKQASDFFSTDSQKNKQYQKKVKVTFKLAPSVINQDSA